MIHTKHISYICLAAAISTLAAAAKPNKNPCDPAYVQQKGAALTVLPTDHDDTANLQCAIDYAAALGPGMTVRLAEHTYKTAQLVVEGFRGTIRGAGREKTVVRNGDLPMPVQNPVTWSDLPPSSSNPYPTLISVIGDDVVLSDLSIHIVGPNPTTPWYFFGTGPYTFVVPALSAVGSKMSLSAERIEIAGSDKCFPDPEGNLLAGIEFWNFASSQQPWPTSSTLVVADSVLKSCGGIVGYDLVKSKVVVKGNKIDAVYYGLAVSDLRDSSVVASSNEINVPSNTAAGIDVWGGNLGTGIRDSSLLFLNNKLAGYTGIWLEDNWVTPDPNDATFYGKVPCAILNNDVSQESKYGYWLRPGTYGCLIVGHGPGTVFDETGGAHTIIGVKPVGATAQANGVKTAAPSAIRRGKGLPQ